MLLEANRLALELTEGDTAKIAAEATRRVNFGFTPIQRMSRGPRSRLHEAGRRAPCVVAPGDLRTEARPSAAIAATPPAPVAPISVCQLAANGGPILGDRGIGGTGLSADEERLVERGIGGTGIGTQIPPSVVRGLTEKPWAGRRPKMRGPAMPESSA